MKWIKENAPAFLMTAVACAVGIVVLAPLISSAVAKFTKKAA